MSDHVLRWQKALKAESIASQNPDFHPGTIDGVDGPKTQAALAAWRRWAQTCAQGIDISKWQDPKALSWPVIAANGVSFAYIKSSDGLGQDPAFEKHWEGARGVGILRGAYHFYRPNRPPLEQARKVAALSQGGELPIALDVERDAPGPDGKEGTPDDIITTEKEVLLCLQEIERVTGKRPILYSYGPFLTAHQINLFQYPLFIADYRSGPPTCPAPWKSYCIHQYQGDKGRTIGIAGPCDQDRFRGTIEQLEEWGERGA